MAQSRGLKNRTNLASTVKIELAEWVRNYSQETKIPISKILDMSIELYKSKVEIKATR